MKILCTTHSTIGGISRVQQHIRDYFDSNHITYHEILYRPGSIRSWDKFIFIRKLQKATKPGDDVIFTHPHLFRAMNRISVSDINTIVFTHGLELYNIGPEEIHHLLKRSSSVITNSRYNKNWLENEALLKNVHQTQYPGMKLEASTEKNENIVLCVGRMMKSESYKGQDKLIKAWDFVKHNVPDAELVFCGSGDWKQKLQKMAEQSKYSESIIFEGEITDQRLKEWYRRAAVFAMPSTGEGQGLVWMEALQAGLPVIAVAGTVAEECIEDRKNGLLLHNALDVNELAGALIKALSDVDWRAEVRKTNIATNQYQLIKDRFNSVLDELMTINN